ncbi:uncharacterized protein XM38_024090 [Halomicronema hongdechloris C2206]|uniref:DUF1838 domain-containing protein n=2 Tax=Halomicronema hongdechloris TaxID=1209493 RepID=A0A1Z3HMU1_9CYAN|nr:uncharacterized protein XM38_024090 [Halomicronema hongdechloris C2206]
MTQPLPSTFLTMALGMGLMIVSLGCPGAEARSLDLSRPEDTLQAFRKLLCSVEDGRTVYYGWVGQVYSRVPGERDRHLFNVQGVSTRACVSLTSETGSPGFRQVSREVMLYLDPETDAVLEHWDNPWTGERNRVMAVANDPVNSSPFWAETTGQRLQFQWLGETDTLFLSVVIPLFYPNPLGSDYQDYVGGYYHAMELFNFAVDRSDLLGSDREEVSQVALSWSRISPWLPWMEMGGRPGEMVFQAASTRLEDWRQLPQPLRTQMETEFALYQEPPPLDDDRPNETTWTNFRHYLEALPTME